MSVEENKAVGRRLLEGFNTGNVEIADKLVDTNFVNHNPDYGVTPDREGLKQYVNIMLTAFPDATVTIDDEIAEGDKVVARTTITGTHKGEIMGIPPTGKQVSIPSILIIRYAEGKAMERWALSDRLSLMQQLGILPTPGQ